MSIWDSVSDFCQLLILVIVLFFIYVLMSDETITYYIFPSTLDPNFKTSASTILKTSPLNNKFKLKEIQSENAMITMRLTPRAELDQYHDVPEYYPSGKQIRFSLTFQGTHRPPRILIDSENWLYGIPESKLSLAEYRQYVVTHEFMHGLGFDHVECKASDETCGVLYQATRGCPTKCGYQVTDVDLNAPRIPERYI